MPCRGKKSCVIFSRPLSLSRSVIVIEGNLIHGMPTLQIAKLGNPVLRQIAAPIDPRNIRTYDIFQAEGKDLPVRLLPGIGHIALTLDPRAVQAVVAAALGAPAAPATH